MEPFGSSVKSGDLAVLDHLLAGGEILPAQMPVFCDWTPERRLAATVLTAALIEVRDHCGERRYERKVAETLEWIGLDDLDWPFSFVRLCQLFDLEPEWVRGMVAHWQRYPTRRTGVFSTYRHAA